MNREIRLVEAKTIIGNMSKPEFWYGCNFNMNIYRGCNKGCIYCDSRSLCYHVEDFESVAAKKDCLLLIEKELKGKRKKGIIGTGSMSDPYNSFEEKTELTRGALKLIDRYGFGVHITTKSDMVLRDIDILESISSHSEVSVGITITTGEDKLGALIEPMAALSSRRFETVEQLNKAGILSGILLMPILPFINDTVENISEIVRRATEVEAKYIFPSMGVTLRSGNREYFYQELDKKFPGIKEKYIRTFGESYECVSPDVKELWAVFTKLSKENGIPYKMKDIIKRIKENKGMDQISFLSQWDN